ncbi:MAG: phosphatidate cytidylyltransferase [Candidatus Omnitrophica bacterium]|nr:phosphatidate cytidylyltransferase [Candidatus Omnitrophota bacterium]
MDKLTRRTIVSMLLIMAVWVIVYVLPNVLFSVVIALFIGFTQFELFKMVERKNVFVPKYFSTAAGCLIPIAIYLEHHNASYKSLEALFLMLFALIIFLIQFVRKNHSGNGERLISISVTLFSLFYISWFFSFFVKLKMLANGANLVAFLIIATKGADIGAYLGGSAFGRHQLIPWISPRKTVEGTLSGIIASTLFGALAYKMLPGFSVLHCAILGLVLGTIGQIGDLAESLIKRDCDVKDSEKYLADIGGVFDLIDSLLFTAPIFYFYIITL